MSSLSLFQGFEDPTGPEFCSVSELTSQIKQVLELTFADVAVRGEISNLARPRSGHVYLHLKDEAASIRAVLWKSTAQGLVFDLTDGLAVRVWGRLTAYTPRSEYQVIIDRIEPEGIGALELAFRQTVARLAAEGLFDQARKRPIPKFPRRIVVVTSPTGAAIRDLLQVTGRRWRATEFLIAPARVQGDGAAQEIVAAIELANRVAGADLVILARGGGSLEDLWAFNEEIVARAIVASRLPVVSAVGHEVDLTIADLAADLRALTPSEAGELCVPDASEVRQRLTRLAAWMARSGRTQVERARARLELLTDRAGRAVREDLADRRQRLSSLADRAERAIHGDLDERRHRLARLAAGLDALSPLAVLGRGYSLTFQADGTALVRSASDVVPGDLIQTRLVNGRIVSRVTERSESPWSRPS
jgi:exodeoxyribonuclease VII large subunit